MSSSQVKKFDNANISLTATIEPACQVKFECITFPPFVKKAYEEGLDRVRKEVSIPGFRKGKAPDSILIKNYAKAVDGEWKDALLNSAFHEAIVLSSLAPLKATSKSIKSSIKEISGSNNEATLTFEFESVPLAPSIDASLLQINTVPLKEVTQEAIDEKIEQTRLSLATWEEIENRGAESGDYVRLDLEEVKNDQLIPNFKNERFQIVDKKMSEWLRELVIGLKAGDSKEGISRPDEALDLDEEEKKQFAAANFKVTLIAIEKPTLPGLDEEFAKRLGVSTIDEVKTAISKNLSRLYQAEKFEKEIEQLQEILISTYSFELPQTLVQKDTQNVVQNQLSRLNPEDAESQRSEIEANAKKAAIKHLTLYYLMRQFNQEHNIQVSNDDLNREVTKLLQQFPQEMLPQIAKALNDDFYTAVLSEITVRKGLDHLLKKISK